jgi:aldehyde oxidoreductase
MPPVESILIEDPSPIGPFGAKGIGEQAVIPTAPAILNAIHDAIGVRIRRVPATPDRIRAALVAPASRRPDGRAGCPPDSRPDADATIRPEEKHA